MSFESNPPNDTYYLLSHQLTSLKTDTESIRAELKSYKSDIKSLEGRIVTVEKDIAVIGSRADDHKCNKISDIETNAKATRSLTERVNTIRSDLGAFMAEVTQKFKSFGLRWSIAMGILSVLVVPTLGASWYIIDKAHYQQTAVILNTHKIGQNEEALKRVELHTVKAENVKITPSQIDTLADKILDKIDVSSKQVIDDRILKEKLTPREQRKLMELLEKAGY